MSRKQAQEQQLDTKYISSIFELNFHAEIFYSRCQDTGQKPQLEKAKMLKEALSKVNSKKQPQVLNLNSMRLGVNTIMKLIGIIEEHHFLELNLADNSISEYGMHAVKTLLSTTALQSLNLASNMISEVGLSLILEEFIKNTHLRTINLGVEEGSIRKNSFGVDGARCLAAVLLQNKTLESLLLQDNDIGINGAEIISIPLKKNKQLRELKIAENLIKTEGAEYILINALHLTSLDLGKNFIKSSIGPTLKRYLQTNKALRKLNLEYNQLLPEGVQTLFEGAVSSLLEELNLRGNAIGDRGLQLISKTFLQTDRQMENLKVLNLSGNEITREGVGALLTIVHSCRLTALNLSRNTLADQGTIELVNDLAESSSGQIIQKLDLSGCKLTDKGFLHLVEHLGGLGELKHLRAADNYISEKYEKVYMDLLGKNYSLISLTLAGNRLSLSGMRGIKKIIERNFRNYDEREPKKMKSQILNLKEKQRKIKEAQEKIERQKKDISKLQDSKNKLYERIQALENEQRTRKAEHEDSIRKRSEQLQAIVESSDSKVEALEVIKNEKERNVENLSSQLASLRERRKQLQYELSVVENEGEMIEKEFERKVSSLK